MKRILYYSYFFNIDLDENTICKGNAHCQILKLNNFQIK